jgi:hypothetical protein
VVRRIRLERVNCVSSIDVVASVKERSGGGVKCVRDRSYEGKAGGEGRFNLA